MKTELFIKVDCILGESPMWHQERNSVWWVDIETGCFFECDIEIKRISK